MSSLLDGAGVRTLDDLIGTLRLPEPLAGKGR
jgi:hypothetical protein